MARITVTRENQRTEKPKISSRYFLTINSNSTLEDLGEEGKQVFERRCEALLNNINKFVYVNPGYPALGDDVSYDVRFEYEVSPKQHRYHSHCILTVNHNTNIKFDLVLLAATAKKYNYYMNCKFVNNDTQLKSMLEYIHQEN